MKNSRWMSKTAAFVTTLAVAGVMIASAADAQKATYVAQPDKTTVKWVGKKVTGQHNGTVPLKSGEISATGDVVTGGRLVIDMTGIKDDDLTDAEWNGKLIGHLKSDDFFGTEKYPIATFEIAKVTPIVGAKAGEPNYKVEGNLTIKATTKPNSFPASISIANGTLKASGVMKVDRTAYDIRYGSKKFFQSIGDKAIYDEFTVDFDVTAAKK